MKKEIRTDSSLCEIIEYKDSAFPVLLSKNRLSDFRQREFSCHWHEEFELGVVANGSAEYTIYTDTAKESFTLNKGDAFFINSRIMHSAREILPDTIIADVIFPLDFMRNVFTESVYRRSVLPLLKSRVTSITLKLCHQNAALIRSVKELCELSQDNVDFELRYLELMCGTWRQLLSYITQSDNSMMLPKTYSIQEERARNMLSYIQTHFSENITVLSIAGSANISRSECFRIFHDIIGKTPVEYLSDHRFAKACEMLLCTNKTITDICCNCGFNDTSYFCKVFKKRYGVSPNKYRTGQKK